MQLGHPFVVAPEEGREILCQILFIRPGQGANDAKVQRDIAAKRGRRNADLNVARVHVGVKETVTKHLREENGDAVPGQLRNIHPRCPQAIHLTDGNPVHALHHNDFSRAIVPEHLGNQHQIKPGHVAAQLRGTGGLTHQIELVMQVFVKLSHHLARLETLAAVGEALYPAGHHAHQSQVFFDRREHTGPQHLDGNFPGLTRPVFQHGKMHLCNRGAGDWLPIE